MILRSSGTIFAVICLLRCCDQTQVVSRETEVKYEPTWESLDARPLPGWFDDAKFGIFLHWGVYSVPSYGSEWFWDFWKGKKLPAYNNYMKKNFPPGFTYQDFARDFTAEFFEPNDWAKLFKTSGAKYVVLTSKHHEGYSLWPSKYSFSWNAMDVGPHRDLVGDLATAIRTKTDLHFGLYHSWFEWFNPLFLSDKTSGFTETKFVQEKALPELYELVEKYQPDVIWSDGDPATAEYWKSKEFLAWLYNESPVRDTVVVNDRWGTNTSCSHGGFYSCADRYSPGVLQPHKWENAMTIDKKSWGYRRATHLEDFLTTHDLISELMKTVSCGGNLLMNVGPTKEGLIIPLFQERLLDIGSWLAVNGEAVYASRAWLYQEDEVTKRIWYTARPDLKAVYASVLDWPKGDILYLQHNSELFKDDTKVELLGVAGFEIKWNIQENKVALQFPSKSNVTTDWVWVLKFNI